MLIEFRLSNYRSVKEEQVLTMAVGSGVSEDDDWPRTIPGASKALLPVAALYGGNASGKTSILAGLAYMQQAALYSHRSWAPEGGTGRDPFAWSLMAEKPSLFEVSVVVDGIRYQYGFLLDDNRFLEEWLHAWPKGKKQVWFHRERDAFKFGESLVGEKSRLVEQVTRPNALFLSAAVQHRHEQLRPLYSWFRDLVALNMDTIVKPAIPRMPARLWLAASLRAPVNGPVSEQAAEERALRSAFVEMLRAADVGITDMKIEPVSEEFHDASIRSFPNVQIFFQHGSGETGGWLPLEKESQGTATLFRYGREIITTLRKGGTLVVDELERSLHPILALWIVGRFNCKVKNPKNAQLIFSTHDTNLLGTSLGARALRRDQVWLTEKNAEGATDLYPLTDFRARKEENLERGYLQGRYGAIPMPADFDRSWE